MQRSNKVWPQLRLHDENQLRVNFIQKTANGIRQIIRKVNMLNVAAKSRLNAL
jgi:hypothetical protein